MAAVYSTLERAREKARWEKYAYLAVWVANSSGLRKRPVTLQQVMPRFRDTDVPPIDVEQRRREAMETFRLHKEKFWTLIGGSSLDDIQTDIPEDVLNRMQIRKDN